MQALEVARQEYEALDPRPRFTDAPKQPSAAERKLQVVTHLPFRAWCAFCVPTNSRGYHKHRSTPDGRATIQVGLFAMPNYMGVLLMVDVWTKYVGVEPLRNKNAGVIGTILARFLSNLSYFDAVEVSYDNEPVLSAGVNMTEVIRSNQGLPMTPQPGKMYSKSRTGLAERTIQTVRAQGQCLVAFLEKVWLPTWLCADVLTKVEIVHLEKKFTPWILCERPINVNGEEDVGWQRMKQTMTLWWLVPAKFWGTKLWGKNQSIGMQLWISMEVGPWDLRRGTQTILKLSKPLAQPLPRLHGAEGEVEPERDIDEEAVIKYAKNHLDENKEEAGEPLLPRQELQAVDNQLPEISDAEFEGMIAEAAKRDRERELALPMVSKQRVADPEGVKRPTGNQPSTQAKFVKFDHTKSEEQKAKHSRTGGMFSPTFAGHKISSPTAATSSPSTTTGHVRRITEEIELYDEDEIEEKIPLETWDWDVNDQLLDGDFSEHEISEVDKAKRGFHNENAGPPQVSAGELAYLDKQAMYAELERLRQLEVISDV